MLFYVQFRRAKGPVFTLKVNPAIKSSIKNSLSAGLVPFKLAILSAKQKKSSSITTYEMFICVKLLKTTKG